MSHTDNTPNVATPGGARVLREHAQECAECGTQVPIDRLAGLLDSTAVSIDAAALSQRVLQRVRPELERRAGAAWWRRVAAALLVALVPLPLVVAYDAYLLQMVYGLVSALLPSTVAAYLVLSYAAFLVLLFATTYAAIPLVLSRPPRLAGGGATT